MKNAKEEFLEHIECVSSNVKCVDITYQDCWHENLESKYILPVGYTEEEYKAFIDLLDFEYDGQKLFGTIWYEDDTWSDRSEYNECECWLYNIYPEIPKELLTKSLHKSSIN